MFCPKCGAQLRDGSKFCVSCGFALGAPMAQAAPQQQSQPQFRQYQPQYQQYQQPQYQQYPQSQYQQPVSRKRSCPFPMRLVGLIGALLLLGSVFLPFISVYGNSENMIDLLPDMLIDDFADTYFFLGFAALGIGFSLSGLGIAQILTGFVSLGLSVYEFIWLSNRDASEYLSVGFYGLAVGALVLVIGGIVCIVGKHRAR